MKRCLANCKAFTSYCENCLIHVSLMVNRSSVYPLGLCRGFALPNWSVRMEEMLWCVHGCWDAVQDCLVAMPSCGNAGAGFLLSPVRRRNAASTFPGRTTCPVTDHCSIYWITAWMIHYIKIPLQLNCFKWRYSSQCLDVKGKTTYPATMCALQRKNERLAQEVRKCDCVDSERE